MANLRLRVVFAFLMMSIVGTSGCSSDDSSTPAPSSSSSGGSSSGGTTTPGSTTTYKGTFAGAGGDGGAIDVTVGSAKSQSIHILTVQQVSGTLHLSAGGSVTITGTFDDATKQLSITGGGYTFTGTATSDGVNGTYTGPKGSGSFNVFASATATPYCGTFAGDSQGVWNFVVNEGKASGSAVSNTGTPDTLTGTVTNGTVTLTTTNGTSANGKIEGTNATGTWSNTAAAKQGTWTGTAGCGG